MNGTSCFRFRLYVAGTTPNSVQARANLSALCRRHLPGRYKIEIVDVSKQPDRALIEGIFMTPSLMKISPSPTRMIVGTLSPSDALMRALGLADLEPVPGV
jgi:circadian clock protein KaiB